MDELRTGISVMMGILAIAAIAFMTVALVYPQAITGMVTGLMTQVTTYRPAPYQGDFGAFTMKNTDGGCFARCDGWTYGTTEHRDCYISCRRELDTRLP